MKKSKKKPSFTTPPKKGDKKSFGKNMGGVFGVTAKKTEPDNAPQKRHAMRTARLTGKLI